MTGALLVVINSPWFGTGRSPLKDGGGTTGIDSDTPLKIMPLSPTWPTADVTWQSLYELVAKYLLTVAGVQSKFEADGNVFGVRSIDF